MYRQPHDCLFFNAPARGPSALPSSLQGRALPRFPLLENPVFLLPILLIRFPVSSATLSFRPRPFPSVRRSGRIPSGSPRRSRRQRLRFFPVWSRSYGLPPGSSRFQATQNGPEVLCLQDRSM